MGYYSWHELEIIQDHSKEPLTHEEHEKNIADLYGWDDLWENDVKGCIEDTMLKYSRKHPDVIFRVFRRGEESDDIWNYYYYRGSESSYTLYGSGDDFTLADFELEEVPECYVVVHMSSLSGLPQLYSEGDEIPKMFNKADAKTKAAGLECGTAVYMEV